MRKTEIYLRLLAGCAAAACAVVPGVALAQKPPPLGTPPGASPPAVTEEQRRIAQLELNQLSAMMSQLAQAQSSAQPQQQDLNALLAEVQARLDAHDGKPSPPPNPPPSTPPFTPPAPTPLGPGTGPIDISRLDMLSALLAVQAQRASLLDGQVAAKLAEATRQRNRELAVQISDVKQREAEAAALRTALDYLQQMNAVFTTGPVRMPVAVAAQLLRTMVPLKQREINAALAAGGYARGLPSLSGSRVGLNLQMDTTPTQIERAVLEILRRIDVLVHQNQTQATALQAQARERQAMLDAIEKMLKDLQESRSLMLRSPA